MAIAILEQKLRECQALTGRAQFGTTQQVDNATERSSRKHHCDMAPFSNIRQSNQRGHAQKPCADADP
jgi:hypothetical protein